MTCQLTSVEVILDLMMEKAEQNSEKGNVGLKTLQSKQESPPQNVLNRSISGINPIKKEESVIFD